MINPVHHIVVMNVPVQASTTFEAGTPLSLNSSGFAIKANATSTVIGLAADRNRSAEAYEYVNRVSDMGNDTGASGQVSVYTGGIFYVDIDEGASGNLQTPLGTVVRGIVDDAATVTPGTALYSNASGELTHTSGGGTLVGYVIESASELESGIPGEYEPGSSLNLVDDTQPRQWIKIKLAV